MGSGKDKRSKRRSNKIKSCVRKMSSRLLLKCTIFLSPHAEDPDVMRNVIFIIDGADVGENKTDEETCARKRLQITKGMNDTYGFKNGCK